MASFDVIFIGGRSRVGESSVAAEASHLLGLADVQHAVIEGDNLDQARGLVNELMARVRSIPGVTTVGAASFSNAGMIGPASRPPKT